MRIRILGSAAGGGLPQWNCRCEVCEAARVGGARPRTQSSIAIRSDIGPWFLINASPDLRQQLGALPAAETNGSSAEHLGLRSTPIAGIIITDAEIDHTAGLLLLRESDVPLQIYSTEEVREALTEHYPVLAMLEHYCGVRWHPLTIGSSTRLEGSSIEVEPFATGGDPPMYIGGGAGPGAIGLTIRELEEQRVLCYAPALEALDGALVERMRASDCVLADGTFWRGDEMVTLGLSERDAHAMGHAPLSGPDGTLRTLSELAPRTVLVHINNTNPILLEESEPRATTETSGVEVSYDGMEIDL